MRYRGILSSWNDERSFGFITPDESEKQVFAHIQELSGGRRRPNILNPATLHDFRLGQPGKQPALYFSQKILQYIPNPPSADR